MIRPPFLQIRAWSSEKGAPHPSQLEENSEGASDSIMQEHHETLEQ